jgi:hypothetical protein
MKTNKLNLNGAEKISTIGLDSEMEKKMKKSVATYVATKDGVTTSEFYSVEKPSRKKFKKFNEAFLNELNREELFIGSLGLRMLEETDEATKLDYVQTEVKNINNRVVRKIRTYSDGSVQIFQVVAKKSNRHFYNGSIFTYITRQFTTGEPITSSEDEAVKTASKTSYGYQMQNLKTVRELSRFGLASRIALAKQASRMAYHEAELQAMRF